MPALNPDSDTALAKHTLAKLVDVPLLVKVNEAAAMIGVNRRSIYKLASVNKLELVKIGKNTTRVTGASLLRLAGVHDQD